MVFATLDSMNALATLETIHSDLLTRETEYVVDVTTALATARVGQFEMVSLTEEWSWLAGESVELEGASDLIALQILKGL